MKTYVLTVSRQFPVTHKRKGEPTYFVEKILNQLIPFGLLSNVEELRLNINRVIFDECDPKIHTIRSNYSFWDKRIKEVQAGNAILSLRYWNGNPYKSKQVEFAVLDETSGCYIQKLSFLDCRIDKPYVYDERGSIRSHLADIRIMAKNDGLEFEDFKDWFKNYDLSKPMAIIHFSEFKY